MGKVVCVFRGPSGNGALMDSKHTLLFLCFLPSPAHHAPSFLLLVISSQIHCLYTSQPSAFRAFHTHKMICFYTNHLFHGKYTILFFTQMIPNPGKRLGRMGSLHYKHKEIVMQRDQVICPGLYS